MDGLYGLRGGTSRETTHQLARRQHERMTRGMVSLAAMVIDTPLARTFIGL
jgi:hypothetical protein